MYEVVHTTHIIDVPGLVSQFLQYSVNMYAIFTLFTMQHRLNEIETFFKKLAEKYNNLVTFVDSIGKTIQKKPMFAVHITKSDKDEQEKPKIYIQCLVHASK